MIYAFTGKLKAISCWLRLLPSNRRRCADANRDESQRRWRWIKQTRNKSSFVLLFSLFFLLNESIFCYSWQLRKTRSKHESRETAHSMESPPVVCQRANTSKLRRKTAHDKSSLPLPPDSPFTPTPTTKSSASGVRARPSFGCWRS